MALIKNGIDAGTEALKFALSGLTGETNAVATAQVQSYSQTTKTETKEVRDKSGDVVLLGQYKKTDDITIDFAGVPSTAHHVGSAMPAAYEASAATETVCIDEVTRSLSNEGVRTTSIKATGYYSDTSA